MAAKPIPIKECPGCLRRVDVFELSENAGMCDDCADDDFGDFADFEQDWQP